ncbi:MAG: glycerate kinase [Burkholderiaceae bacterium]
MDYKKLFVPLGGLALLVVAWRSAGWPGLALAAGILVMWLLLHVTRTLRVLQRAAHRPVGYVASAVMLNAKLQPGMSLLHVVAMTQSLGLQISAQGTQPEIFCWRDEGQSHVTCEFAAGKLTHHELVRPEGAD